jgi:PDZ domain
MLSLVRGDGRLPLTALALALGISIFSGSLAVAGDHGSVVAHEGRFKHNNLGYGTLGWAEYGLYPGLYGFSLHWHPGYGYGRYALGVGADGGYPFYGGPGYPHEPPHLRRFGPTEPYAYFGGPGYPISGWSNFYQGVGGLVVDKPVVSIGEPGDFGYVGENGERNPGADFGPFTGALPYPETYFAPNAAAATRSSGAEGLPKPAMPFPDTPPATVPGPSSASLSPALGEMTEMHGPARYLGIDEEPTVDAEGIHGMKVTRVFPGSAAEKAGLHAGDVIHWVNGYFTTKRGNLAWIISVATPNNVLKMNVRTASDGSVHTILAQLPAAQVNTPRTSFLPPVGNGPPPASR